MSRFLLVHGAFAGAWCWEPILAPLRALGHTVDAIDLPGSGDDQTPVAGATLEAYAERVCATLTGHDEPAVLVGHSMGGVVITQAAARCPEAVSQLIYVAAFVPRDGQSLLDLTRLPEGAGDQVQANIVIDGDPPVATMPDGAAQGALYSTATDEQAAWAIARHRPQPLAPFATPVTIGSGTLSAMPRAYVSCTKDRSIPPALQRRMIAENGIERIEELACDHGPFLSAPDELVGALDRLAVAPQVV